MRCPCVYCFVSSRSRIVFNPSAGAITDHSQAAKNIDPYFKFQLYVEDPGHRKPVLSLPNWLSEPGERAYDRNFTFCSGWDSNSQPLDRQSSVLPLSYHRSSKLLDEISNELDNNNHSIGIFTDLSKAFDIS